MKVPKALETWKGDGLTRFVYNHQDGTFTLADNSIDLAIYVLPGYTIPKNSHLPILRENDLNSQYYLVSALRALVSERIKVLEWQLSMLKGIS